MLIAGFLGLYTNRVHFLERVRERYCRGNPTIFSGRPKLPRHHSLPRMACLCGPDGLGYFEFGLGEWTVQALAMSAFSGAHRTQNSAPGNAFLHGRVLVA